MSDSPPAPAITECPLDQNPIEFDGMNWRCAQGHPIVATAADPPEWYALTDQP